MVTAKRSQGRVNGAQAVLRGGDAFISFRRLSKHLIESMRAFRFSALVMGQRAYAFLLRSKSAVEPLLRRGSDPCSRPSAVWDGPSTVVPDSGCIFVLFYSHAGLADFPGSRASMLDSLRS